MYVVMFFGASLFHESYERKYYKSRMIIFPRTVRFLLRKCRSRTAAFSYGQSVAFRYSRIFETRPDPTTVEAP
jgi:hypothetical protein